MIEAQDRYFTLQEAQQGAITEEVLKAQAISEGKVKPMTRKKEIFLKN